MARRGKNYKSFRKTKKVPENIRKYVHKIVDEDPEMKQWCLGPFNYGSVSETSGAGSEQIINEPSAVVGSLGTDFYQRIGAQIKCHSIEVSCSLNIAPNAAVQPGQSCRILIFMDKDTDGVRLPNSEIIYSGNTLDLGVTSPYRETYKSSWHMLHDRVITFNPTVTDNSNLEQQVKVFKFRYKFKRPIKMTYYGSLNYDVTDIQGPSIWVRFLADYPSVQVANLYTNMIFTDA